jgi:hypothetical protein
MNLYRRYFDLVADGSKTVEVRVQYPNLRKLAAGDYIRFVCGRDDALTRVKRVARYTTHRSLMDQAEIPIAEKPAGRALPFVNTSSRVGQSHNWRGIFGAIWQLMGPRSQVLSRDTSRTVPLSTPAIVVWENAPADQRARLRVEWRPAHRRKSPITATNSCERCC